MRNQELSFGNVCMIQNSFTYFDRNSCIMFKLSTECSTLNWLKFHNQTQAQSHNEINTHTEHLDQKLKDLLSLKEAN